MAVNTLSTAVWLTYVLTLVISQLTVSKVTLKHGGQLLGKRTQHNSIDVDLFYDVPYAKPPVGSLRFKKPEPANSWTGVKNATIQQYLLGRNTVCAQPTLSSPPTLPGVVGSEDCLYLDIAVPGGAQTGANKAVMVFIHGGGNTLGSKDAYKHEALAARGDVIVININYRLGILGFLSEGKGTGNFGLWDQRQALLWIKENIGEFGGDADMVTIFGESAGSASVSAQVMGRYNEGLFRRAIQESGSLYSDWGWFKSANQIHEIAEETKEKQNCTQTESLYTCLANLNVTELNDAFNGKYPVPMPDSDFFPDDIFTEKNVLSQRFDQMIGFNKDEGYGLFIGKQYIQLDKPIKDGLSIAGATKLVKEMKCKLVTPMSVQLCIDYLMNMYHLDSITDDGERARAFSDLMTDMGFAADSLQQLQDHSATNKKSTYAYYFTEGFTPQYPPFEIPDWVPKSRADHGDELGFVFGAIYLKEADGWEEYMEGAACMNGYTDVLQNFIRCIFNGSTTSDKPLTDAMMTMWANFAKSGNPNQPMSLPAGVPSWPQFDTTNEHFIELNTDNITVIKTPRKEKLEALLRDLFPARGQQIEADAPAKVMYEDCPDSTGPGRQIVVSDDKNSCGKTTLTFAFLLGVIAVYMHL